MRVGAAGVQAQCLPVACLRFGILALRCQRQTELVVPLGEIRAEQPILGIAGDGELGRARSRLADGDDNEARRLVQNGGVTIGPDRDKIADPMAAIAVSPGLIVRVGARRIVRITLK